VFAPDPPTGLEAARDLVPNLVVIDGASLDRAADLLLDLRHDGATRRVSLAVIAAPPGAAGEEALRRAGANLVLPAPVDPVVWNRRLEELLDVPPRRESRLKASFQLWCRAESQETAHEAVVLNLSVRGMLIETREPLPVGSTVDLRLSLPGDAGPLPLVGLVVRNVPFDPHGFRGGVQFLILRDHVRERLRSYIETESAE
jgi:hypothetical protein